MHDDSWRFAGGFRTAARRAPSCGSSRVGSTAHPGWRQCIVIENGHSTRLRKGSNALRSAHNPPCGDRDDEVHLDVLLTNGTPRVTTWNISQTDGPNHLGVWRNALPGHPKGGTEKAATTHTHSGHTAVHRTGDTCSAATSVRSAPASPRRSARRGPGRPGRS